MGSIQGLSETMKRLSRITRNLSQNNVSRVCRSVAEEGATMARNIYSVADYDGDRNVDVKTARIENGATLTASGPSVLFIEFGAGVMHAGEQHPWNEEMGMGPGTWPNPQYRKNSAGQLVPNWMNDKGWYFGSGRHTFGNPPAMAMYEAGKVIEARLPQEMRKVFDT